MLALDPHSNPRAECMDSSESKVTSNLNKLGSAVAAVDTSTIVPGSLMSPLVVLQKNVISLIRGIFQSYEEQRATILHDMLPLFAQVFIFIY